MRSEEHKKPRKSAEKREYPAKRARAQSAQQNSADGTSRERTEQHRKQEQRTVFVLRRERELSRCGVSYESYCRKRKRDREGAGEYRAASFGILRQEKGKDEREYYSASRAEQTSYEAAEKSAKREKKQRKKRAPVDFCSHFDLLLRNRAKIVIIYL